MNENDKKTYDLISQWLEEYKLTDEESAKAKIKTLIVSAMLPIIKRIAHTIARRSYDPIDDLVQAGSIGLLKAINDYSSNINDSFQVYAGYKIIGEMKHYLRDKLNMVRVPRHIQELVFRINSFTATLTLEEVKSITSDEVAEALNVSKNEVDYAMDVDRRKYTISFEELFNTSEDKTLSYEELIVGKDYKEESTLNDIKIILRGAIKNLPDEYRELIELYYYQDMNQKDIAEKLNITRMMVSRKLKKAFSILYDVIENSAGVDELK